MFVRVVSTALFAVAFLSLTGCGPAKLDVSKTVNLTGEYPAKGIELDAQPKPQTITIEFSSSAGEVTVLVFKKSDAPTDDDLLNADPKKAIAMKKGKSDSFTADIPENTPARVAVRMGAEKTDVDLKITNKK